MAGGNAPQNAAAAAAASGKSKMPHAGKPLPGGASAESAPWWAAWRDKVTTGTQGMQRSWALQTRKWKRQGKFQMPVHVEMDFINPLAESIKEGWQQLPPPVQRGAPIAGAALFTALVVHQVERGKLRAEKERNVRLRSRNDELLGEREGLYMQIAELRGKASGHKSPGEVNMARALSEATQAAAAAATAAAHAASMCRPKMPSMKPPQSPQPT